MSGIINLVARDDSDSTSFGSHSATALIIVLVVVILALITLSGFLFVRYRRRSQQGSALPLYEEKRLSGQSITRRLTVKPTESIYVYQEKQNLLENSDAPPSDAVPEIRITFPEEVDHAGKRQSGRVVVVHVGEKSMGLGPVIEDLPPYQQSESDRFQSIDLERIGGLREKDSEARWQ